MGERHPAPVRVDSLAGASATSLMARLFTRIGLQFPDPDTESAFVKSYCIDLRVPTQIALLVGSIVIPLFSFLDRYVGIESWETGLFIRSFIMTPAALAALVVISLRQFDRYYEQSLMFAITVTFLGLIAICVLVPASYAIYALPLTIASIFGWSILPIRVKHQTVLAGILIVGFPTSQVLVTSPLDSRLLMMNTMTMVALGGIGLLAGYIREIGARRQFLAIQELQVAKFANEELLHSLVPSHMVRRMQDGEKTIADAYADATVIFVDLVGFTPLTRRLSPRHMVDLLARLFREFDELADKYGVQRIKTLGDGYLAVGGIRKDSVVTGSPEDSARFALEIRRAVQLIAQELGEPLELRTGIHVGFAVVGVVGQRNLLFDCWGESVNLASRLQSHADPGATLISEAMYLRLHKSFNAQFAGEFSLKGIGATKAYSLTGAKA